MAQVVSFDNLEDQELEKREVSEGLFLLCLHSEFTVQQFLMMTVTTVDL